MNIEQYISSGVIEAYALGLASPEEVRELEELCVQYPEVKAAVQDAQIAVEQFASLHAVAPPPETKQQIWDRIRNENNTSSMLPHEVLSNEPASTTLLPKGKNNISIYKYAAGIALLLLAGSIAYNFISTADYQKKLHTLSERTSSLEANNSALSGELNNVRKNMAIISDPAMKSVLLDGVEGHAGNKAIVYWNSNTKDVYLSLSNLPQPPKGKQYQLWAIVDGKPVDAGVYAFEKKQRIQSMKNIQAAQMFAITLENEGGSAVPTLTEMYVAGKI